MNNKTSIEEETKKLTFVVIVLSIFIIVLFGLAPSI